MLKITKAEEPQELIDFKNQYSNSIGWDQIEDKIPGFKNRLKEYILKHEQKINKNYCCVYCERKITTAGTSSHIEHIKPKTKYKNETYNYENLTVSCQEETFIIKNFKTHIKTCGHHKENEYDERKFVNPVTSNPGDYFTYSWSDGEIIPSKTNITDLENAQYTINLLNLNHSHLTDTRKNILNLLYSIDDKDELIYVIENCDQFPGLYRFFKEECIDTWEQEQKTKEDKQ